MNDEQRDGGEQTPPQIPGRHFVRPGIDDRPDYDKEPVEFKERTKSR